MVRFAQSREKMMSINKKVAVLYIATRRYTVFWKELYQSAEKFFLPHYNKDYFVFTDNEHIDFEENHNILKVFQNKLGWPYDTLMRFDIFLKQENLLKSYDYIFFLNANLLFVDEVNEEILPENEIYQGLTVCLHPGFYKKEPDNFTYDRNPLSQTCIPFGQGKYYVAGGFNGGKAKDFLELCHQCKHMIQADLENNIIPLWHDESAINKYILDKTPLILDPSYLYPEGWKLKDIKKAKIIIRDKSNPIYGGHDWLRGLTDIPITKTKKRHWWQIVFKHKA
jgi:hypothetical protein